MFSHHNLSMRRLILLFACCVFLSLQLVILAAQTQLDSDSFNGTAGTGLHTYNAKWRISPYAVNHNELILSTPNGSTVCATVGCIIDNNGQSWTNDQYAQVTFTTLPSTKGFLCLRMQGDNTDLTAGWCVGINPNVNGTNHWLLSKATSLDTAVTTSATNASAGDVLNFQIAGNVVTVAIGGAHLVDMDTTTDGSFPTGGNPGMVINDATGKFSAWSAGSVGTGATCNGGLLLRGAGGC